MNFLENTIKLLNKIYEFDNFIRDFLAAICNKLSFIYEKLLNIKEQFFFNTLDSDGCNFYEKMLNLPSKSLHSLEDRQAAIQAKWLSNNHSNITLIQLVCDSWKNGEVMADFINNKISLEFINIYGIPGDLESLLNAVKEIKPAHIDIFIKFKYLLIKDIHMLETIEQIEKLTIDKFAFE